MPSPAANQLTRAHRAELAATVALIVRDVRTLALRADLGAIDSWWARIFNDLLALVAAGWATTRAQGAGYLRQHAAIERHDVDPVLADFDLERVTTSLRVTGPVAFKTHVSATGEPEAARAVMATALEGSTTRLVLAGERETVERTVDDSDEIVGWRRVTDADPCFWCAMLAGRGAVYTSETAAVGVVGRRGVTRGTRGFGESYHDGDQCTAEPLYEGEAEPEWVLDLQDQWEEVTAGTSGKAAIRAWRNYWMARERG